MTGCTNTCDPPGFDGLGRANWTSKIPPNNLHSSDYSNNLKLLYFQLHKMTTNGEYVKIRQVVAMDLKKTKRMSEVRSKTTIKCQPIY